MGRLEISNGDGTIRVDDVTVHLVPSPDAEAYVDQEVKDAALRQAASNRDLELLGRIESRPILSQDPSAIRVNFVEPDVELEEVLLALGDDAWNDDTGRMRIFMSSLAHVVDGRVYSGCSGHFLSVKQQTDAIRLIACSDLSDAQKRRLIARCQDTPVVVAND